MIYFAQIKNNRSFFCSLIITTFMNARRIMYFLFFKKSKYIKK
jgi:hypothetical protein